MYLLIKILYAIFSRFPLTLLTSLGFLLGTVMYHLLPSRRDIAIKNCEVIGIEKQDIKRVVKQSFRHTFASYMESFHARKISEEYIDNNVETEYIGTEKPENNAFFAASAHFGAWELAPYVMSYKLDVYGALVARKVKDPRVDAFIEKQRANKRLGYIHHRGASEKIKEYMQKEQTVGVLLDHSSMPKDSMAVPFFGLNTTFMRGIPLLSARSGYPVLPLFLLRKQNGFKLKVYPPIYPDKSLKPRERAHDIALRINQVYEEVIKENPEQWYLIHKRFKRVTDSEGKFISGIY